MSKALKVLGIALLLTAAVSMMAADASYPATGKVWNINLPSAMKVNGVLLPAGDYKVQHIVDGGNHVLVFKTRNDKEKVRANCKLEKLPNKVDETIEVSDLNSAGERVLQSVAFKGDTFRHELVNP